MTLLSGFLRGWGWMLYEGQRNSAGRCRREDLNDFIKRIFKGLGMDAF